MLIHKARSMLLVAPYGSDGGFHFQWRQTRRHSWGVRQELSTGLSLPPSCPRYPPPPPAHSPGHDEGDNKVRLGDGSDCYIQSPVFNSIILLPHLEPT